MGRQAGGRGREVKQATINMKNYNLKLKRGCGDEGGRKPGGRSWEEQAGRRATTKVSLPRSLSRGRGTF